MQKASFYRLKKDKDFALAFKKGKTITSPCLVLKYFRNENGRSYCGFVASAKVFKKAVLRNRIKRMLREALRGMPIPAFHGGGNNMILIARPGIENKKLGEIKEMLASFFKKLG